jgi:rSAM/selenodomain-associated transferase 2
VITTTFVIPVLNEAENIRSLLQYLFSGFPGCQCVVVDGGSSDTTLAEAAAGGADVISSDPGRAVQMNAGAAAATGDYLFFLHADTRPSINATQLQCELQTQPEWGFFRVRLSGSQWMFRVIERAMNLRSTLSSVATGDQMLFITKALFERSGGYRDIPLMEDVEYCKRLRRIARPQVVAQVVETSSRRWEQNGIASTVIQMWLLRLAYFFGVPATRLKAYYSNA